MKRRSETNLEFLICCEKKIRTFLISSDANHIVACVRVGEAAAVIRALSDVSIQTVCTNIIYRMSNGVLIILWEIVCQKITAYQSSKICCRKYNNVLPYTCLRNKIKEANFANIL